MKRSQAVNIIKDMLVELELKRKVNGDPFTNDDRADIILNILEEKVEMLPPADEGAWADYYGTESVGQGIDRYCDWEEE